MHMMFTNLNFSRNRNITNTICLRESLNQRSVSFLSNISRDNLTY